MPITSTQPDRSPEHCATAGTVLVVDDPLVSKLAQTVLRRHGFDVIIATIDEALVLLQTADSAVGALVTNSPGAFLEFADQVPLLYLTSSPDALVQCAFRSCRVVLKPFMPVELARAVEAITGTL